MEVILLIRQVIERYMEQKKDLHMKFIDLEKIYDKIARNVILWTLEKKNFLTKYVTLIKNMYTNIVTSVRACDGESNIFSINIRLHQGSTLSLYIFTLVMDEVTKDIQGDISWGMLFVDDAVLTDESEIRVD
jgi:Reverse transcriptase (RNA-dependent DNA polymerase)